MSESSRPATSFRVGCVAVDIWKHKEKRNGRTEVRFRIKIEKIYREKDSNEYRSTQYFFTNELADLEDAARLARQYVRGCALQDTLEESNASAEPEPVAE